MNHELTFEVAAGALKDSKEFEKRSDYVANQLTRKRARLPRRKMVRLGHQA